MPSTFPSVHAPDNAPDRAAHPVIRSPQSFCLSLKAARERRGIPLSKIAASTKVCESHFVALERSDLRAWPKGVFRRAFFRGYVEMIGLPVAETMDEFARLFPDAEHTTVILRRPVDPNAVRLSLDPSWHGPTVPIASRLRTAMIDAGAVLVLATAFAWYFGAHAGTSIAVVSVSYFTLATLLLGDSATASVMRYFRERALRREAVVDEPVGVMARAWNMFGTAGKDTSAETGDSPLRIWSADARRNAPAPAPRAPRFRLRFKLPYLSERRL